MQKNWVQLNSLTNVGTVLRTLELLVGLFFSLSYSGILYQLYPYESWMAVIMEAVMTMGTFFLYIFTSRALDVKNYAPSPGTNDPLPLVDASTTRLAVSSSLMALICCLSLNDLVMRMLFIYGLSESDTLVMWISSALLVASLFFWIKASAVYNSIAQTLPALTPGTRIVYTERVPRI